MLTRSGRPPCALQLLDPDPPLKPCHSFAHSLLSPLAHALFSCPLFSVCSPVSFVQKGISTVLVKMISTAQTGFFYVYRKNPKRTTRSAILPQQNTALIPASHCGRQPTHMADCVRVCACGAYQEVDVSTLRSDRSTARHIRGEQDAIAHYFLSRTVNAPIHTTSVHRLTTTTSSLIRYIHAMHRMVHYTSLHDFGATRACLQLATVRAADRRMSHRERVPSGLRKSALCVLRKGVLAV